MSTGQREEIETKPSCGLASDRMLKDPRLRKNSGYIDEDEAQRVISKVPFHWKSQTPYGQKDEATTAIPTRSQGRSQQN
jgi:hypothetical protein